MNKSIKILNSEELFEVNNIFCIGKNYLDHIKEFGQKDIPENPVIFLKPNSSLVFDEGIISIPKLNGEPISQCLHYEAELVLAIGKDGKNIPESEARDFIKGIAVGLDMTLRDVQDKAKAESLPWTTAKGFTNSAAISDIVELSPDFDPMNLDLELLLNNTRKQFANTSLMIYNIYKLVSHISTIFSIQKGDIIYTGTPSGVGKVQKGDKLKARLVNLVELNVMINE